MYDGRYRRLANLLGQEIVLWSLYRDWRYGVTPDFIIKFVTNKVKGATSFSCMTVEPSWYETRGRPACHSCALPHVIRAIQAKGLEIVPLSVLLHNAPAEQFPQVDIPE